MNTWFKKISTTFLGSKMMTITGGFQFQLKGDRLLRQRKIDLEVFLKLYPEERTKLSVNFQKFSSKIEISPKKKKKKKKKAALVEWVDNSYIKSYTDYEALKVLMEDIERKYPNISEW